MGSNADCVVVSAPDPTGFIVGFGFVLLFVLSLLEHSVPVD